MMPSLFVLDVPEFATLIAGAAGTHKVRRRGGYEGRVVEFSAERLVIGKA